MDQHAELGEFLRTRRARLSPEDAGVAPSPVVRRVPGLRREEVAYLAGVSTDYYARLEQGRQRNVSDVVLDAVARALRLDDVERRHLVDLARPPRAQVSRPRAPRPQRVRPAVHRVLESLDAVSPAFVLGRRMDVLAANRLTRALITDFDALPYRERNMARHMFLDPAARELYLDWDDMAAEIVAILRRDAGRHPDDPLLSELVGELSVKSPEFRTQWAAHQVRERTHGSKRYRHPLVGELTISYEMFTLPADPDQSLCVYTAEANSTSAEALRLLADWTAPNTGLDGDRAGAGSGPDPVKAPGSDD